MFKYLVSEAHSLLQASVSVMQDEQQKLAIVKIYTEYGTVEHVTTVMASDHYIFNMVTFKTPMCVTRWPQLCLVEWLVFELLILLPSPPCAGITGVGKHPVCVALGIRPSHVLSWSLL